MTATVIATDIDELFRLMTETWNRHDIAAYSQLWTKDCDFVNVVGMYREGPGELKAELDFLHADRFKDTEVQVDRTKVRYLTPDIAIAIAWWHMTGDPGHDGFAPKDGRRNGVFTHVIVRTKEGWRFAASQNTDRLDIPDPLHP